LSLPLVFAFVEAVRRWAASVPAVRAVALAGSHASGRARPDSDVDLVVLCDDPGRLVADRTWLGVFGEAAAVSVEDWGAITSLRVRYAGGLEVEWGLGRPSWAATAPLDAGTAGVVAGGFRPLYDPEGLLAALLAATGRRPA
jgi:hypothetical protein